MRSRGTVLPPERSIERQHPLQTILARVVVEMPPVQREHSQKDLARRRLILDQARHRWLLARRRGSALRSPSLDTVQQAPSPRSGPLAVREPTYHRGMRRIGGPKYAQEIEHPVGAVALCRFHTWEQASGSQGVRCTVCGMTSGVCYEHLERHDYPLGAVALCRSHRWVRQPDGRGVLCAFCGTAAS